MIEPALLIRLIVLANRLVGRPSQRQGTTGIRILLLR